MFSWLYPCQSRVAAPDKSDHGQCSQGSRPDANIQASSSRPYANIQASSSRPDANIQTCSATGLYFLSKKSWLISYSKLLHI